MEEQNPVDTETPMTSPATDTPVEGESAEGAPLPGGFGEVPDPFGGPDPVGEQSVPPEEQPGVGVAQLGIDEDEEPSEPEPLERLVTMERPRFDQLTDLRQALGQFLELFPLGRSSTPGAGGASIRALLLLFLVATPPLLVLGTIAAVFAAGLGKFVGDPNKVSWISGMLALVIDTGTCVLIAVGSSAAATWAARVTRCWNASLAAASASIGAVLLAAATFFPLFGDVAFAPMDGWVGPFAIGWWVVAAAVLIGPTAAALLASATVGAGRICPDTGKLLTAAIRVRFGLPEGLAAREVIEEDALEDLAAIDGLPESVENFIEMSLYVGEGAKMAVLELEARFWAEVGPAGDISESSAEYRRARRWLVSSIPIEDSRARKLMSLNWQALAHLAE